jgi:hypothetical protein
MITSSTSIQIPFLDRLKKQAKVHHQRIIALYREHKTIRKTAEAANLSSERIRVILLKNGITDFCRPRKPDLSKENRDFAILILLIEGKTVKEISSRLNESYRIVYQVASKFPFFCERQKEKKPSRT